MSERTSGNLPAARGALIGREAELKALVASIASAPGRLVTVTGAGGIGKTSLALEAARKAAPGFAHGAWIAELAGARVAGDIAAAVATALGLRNDASATAIEALAGHFREREVLLVLDNCEHLIDACAELTDRLLNVAAGLRILASSREPLRVAGEVMFALEPLSVPGESVTDADSLSMSAAAQLFLERARAARPGFDVHGRSALLVAEMCRRLDGIPLAIELAASRVASLSLEELSVRLKESFDVLVARGTSRPDRHQTLRATMEWSYRLLTTKEQAVFRCLSVFAGGWTLEAAENVAARAELPQTEVREALTGLVERSLVSFREVAGAGRYRFLEPVREYARAQLASSDESEATATRHRRFFVGYTARARPAVHGGAQGAWLRSLDEELENIRAAVRSGYARGDMESVLRILGALWWYLWLRGRLREGWEMLEPALGATDVSDDARLGGLGCAAMLLGAQGRSDDAAANAREMLALAESVGDTAETARAATLLGMESFRCGRLLDARPLFERALDEARRAGDAMLIGNALVNLGQVLRQGGEPVQAEALYREGLAVLEESGDLWGIAYAANNLAYALRERGAHAQAATMSRQAVRVLSALGDRFYLIFAVEDLARAAAAQGQTGGSAALFGAAHVLREATGALLPPGGSIEHERDLQALRATLGRSRFEQAWARGKGLPLAELVADTVAAEPRPQSTGGPGGALSAREREVARLLADGMTNREIAERLSITTGTVGIHVEHILRKLDMKSRHQVAAWARDQGMATLRDG